jgi:hypothetical protein
MAIGGFTVGSYKNLTATANVCPNPCSVLGIVVCTTSSGTFTLYDSASTGTGTPITGTFTPSANTFIPIGVECTAGLYVVITNTINITVVYAAG